MVTLLHYITFQLSFVVHTLYFSAYLCHNYAKSLTFTDGATGPWSTPLPLWNFSTQAKTDGSWFEPLWCLHCDHS